MNSLLPWCSLLLPLVSAIAITLFTHRSRALSSFISIGAVLGSFVCSCLIFIRQGISAREFNWIDFVGVFKVPFGFVLDNLSKTMLVLVSGVGSSEESVHYHTHRRFWIHARHFDGLGSDRVGRFC